MLVKTENSTYEIQDDQIRRLTGAAKPTPRQGEDGEWKDFAYLVGPKIGEGLLIVWETSSNEAGEAMIFRSTVTSLVLEIQDV
jgi:hypothetical protein